MSNERRRTPRVEILGRLHGHVVSLDVPVAVRELSLGGLAIETSVAFPVGAVHEFSLTLGDGSAVVLQGRVMHCRNVAAEGEPASFVTGVQFVDDDAPDLDVTVGDILDRITND